MKSLRQHARNPQARDLALTGTLRKTPKPSERKIDPSEVADGCQQMNGGRKRVLQARIDTAEVIFDVSISDAMLAILETHKRKVIQAGEGSSTAVSLGTLGTLNLDGRGLRRSRFVLRNADVQLLVRSDEIKATLRQNFLRRESFGHAMDHVRAIVRAFATSIRSERVTRLDACVDVSLAFSELDPSAFVTRAKEGFEWKTSNEPSTWESSSFALGSRDHILFTAYDKIRQLRAKRKTRDYAEESLRWASAGWVEGSPVTRFEVKLAGLALRQFQLVLPQSVPEQIDATWRKLTRDWVRWTVGDASIRSRRETHPTWIEVQEAVFVAPAEPATRQLVATSGPVLLAALGTAIAALAREGRLNFPTPYESADETLANLVDAFAARLYADADVRRSIQSRVAAACARFSHVPTADGPRVPSTPPRACKESA